MSHKPGDTEEVERIRADNLQDLRCWSCDHWDGYWHQCWLGDSPRTGPGACGPLGYCDCWEHKEQG